MSDIVAKINSLKTRLAEIKNKRQEIDKKEAEIRVKFNFNIVAEVDTFIGKVKVNVSPSPYAIQNYAIKSFFYSNPLSSRETSIIRLFTSKISSFRLESEDANTTDEHEGNVWEFLINNEIRESGQVEGKIKAYFAENHLDVLVDSLSNYKHEDDSLKIEADKIEKELRIIRNLVSA